MYAHALGGCAYHAVEFLYSLGYFHLFLVSYSLWESVWECVDDISSANILTFEDNVVVIRGKVMVNMRK